MPKASVLPVPVRAWPIMSVPVSAIGMAIDWIGKGWNRTVEASTRAYADQSGSTPTATGRHRSGGLVSGVDSRVSTGGCRVVGLGCTSGCSYGFRQRRLIARCERRCDRQLGSLARRARLGSGPRKCTSAAAQVPRLRATGCDFRRRSTAYRRPDACPAAHCRGGNGGVNALGCRHERRRSS